MPRAEELLGAEAEYSADGIFRVAIHASVDQVSPEIVSRIVDSSITIISRTHPNDVYPPPVIRVAFACGRVFEWRVCGEGHDVPN